MDQIYVEDVEYVIDALHQIQRLGRDFVSWAESVASPNAGICQDLGTAFSLLLRMKGAALVCNAQMPSLCWCITTQWPAEHIAAD